jgi:hypothetical protein
MKCHVEVSITKRPDNPTEQLETWVTLNPSTWVTVFAHFVIREERALIARPANLALTWRRTIFRQSNGTLEAKILEYGPGASRKSPIEQPKTAQKAEVTANFCASFQTGPAEKPVKSRPSCVVKWGKHNSYRASTRFLGSFEVPTLPKFRADPALRDAHRAIGVDCLGSHNCILY